MNSLSLYNKSTAGFPFSNYILFASTFLSASYNLHSNKFRLSPGFSFEVSTKEFSVISDPASIFSNFIFPSAAFTSSVAIALLCAFIACKAFAIGLFFVNVSITIDASIITTIIVIINTISDIPFLFFIYIPLFLYLTYYIIYAFFFQYINFIFYNIIKTSTLILIFLFVHKYRNHSNFISL